MQRMSHGTHRMLRLAAALNWSSPSAWQALIGIDNLNLFEYYGELYGISCKTKAE